MSRAGSRNDDWTLAAVAGGSNYGITPGAHPNLAGKVSEWPVPTPRFARDPAVAPDGSIYIAVMSGNKVAHFDPKTQSFKEWDLPSGHARAARGQVQLPSNNVRIRKMVTDASGRLWYMGSHNGRLGVVE